MNFLVLRQLVAKLLAEVGASNVIACYLTRFLHKDFLVVFLHKKIIDWAKLQVISLQRLKIGIRKEICTNSK